MPEVQVIFWGEAAGEELLTVQKARDQCRTMLQRLLEKSFSSRISLHTCMQQHFRCPTCAELVCKLPRGDLETAGLVCVILRLHASCVSCSEQKGVLKDKAGQGLTGGCCSGRRTPGQSLAALKIHL